MKFLAALAIGVVALGIENTASAQIININSSYGFTFDGGGSDPAPTAGQHINIIGSPLVQLTLDPGTYNITNAAGLPGANFSAWSYNVGTSSWAWAFVVADDLTRKVVLYADAGRASSATALAALPAVQNFVMTFSLSAPTTLDFTLRDYHVVDNAGGISLKIESVPASVPVPATIWLFGSALAGLVGFSRRKSF